MNNEINKPLDTIRDGSLKATIWKNPGKDGKLPHYSVDLTWSYKDEAGIWKDTNSFSFFELLRIGCLAEISYNEVLIHRAKDRAESEVSGTAA
ncbi:MAG: hypothetical protein ED559_13845 [Phycisphaera sp.]|nr:MAG: hypothetical protein ED559_13845 [Phycisphaera sp.]